jgi:hypothetical protein
MNEELMSLARHFGIEPKLYENDAQLGIALRMACAKRHSTVCTISFIAMAVEHLDRAEGPRYMNSAANPNAMNELKDALGTAEEIYRTLDPVPPEQAARLLKMRQEDEDGIGDSDE